VSSPNPSSTTTLVATISSDGKILVYDLRALSSSAPETMSDVLSIDPIGEYDTKGTRLICLTLADGGEEDTVKDTVTITGKRKRDDQEDDGEDLASDDNN
jgi:protein MAK11